MATKNEANYKERIIPCCFCCNKSFYEKDYDSNSFLYCKIINDEVSACDICDMYEQHKVF